MIVQRTWGTALAAAALALWANAPASAETAGGNAGLLDWATIPNYPAAHGDPDRPIVFGNVHNRAKAPAANYNPYVTVDVPEDLPKPDAPRPGGAAPGQFHPQFQGGVTVGSPTAPGGHVKDFRGDFGATLRPSKLKSIKTK